MNVSKIDRMLTHGMCVGIRRGHEQYPRKHAAQALVWMRETEAQK